MLVSASAKATLTEAVGSPSTPAECCPNAGTMTKFDSTEAPFSVTVNGGAEGYTGHHEDRPLKVSLDLDADVVKALDDVGVHVEGGEVQTAIAPAEAYHFADDLQAAADECWGSTEYVVNAVNRDGDNEVYLTTIKAPNPETAVRRGLELLETTAKKKGTDLPLKKLEAADGQYRVYRADSMTTVRTDDNDD